MPTISTTESPARNEVSVVLEEDEWHYVISKLRKAVEPGCYEKAFCRLLDVIPRIENQVKARQQTI